MTEKLLLPPNNLGERREALENNERYRMIMVGGRVKSAAVSLRTLYEAASPLTELPGNADAAFAVSQNFAWLRQHPPGPFLDAYFPQDKSMTGLFRGGLGIYRPTLKTDQGPPGNVGHFTIDTSQPTKLHGTITREAGVALLEEHLRKSVISARPEHIAAMRGYIAFVKNYYRQHQSHDDFNYKITLKSLEKLRELLRDADIPAIRRTVGRKEFFFFRPVEIDTPMVVGQNLADAISQKVEEVVANVEARAWLAKDLVKRGVDISVAKITAREITSAKLTTPAGQLYFQPDVLVRADGSFEIERINMPDLGMFLTYEPQSEEDYTRLLNPSIEPPGTNETFDKIRDINTRIKHEVLDVINRNIGQDVVLLTKDETITFDEDTLEQLELRAAQEGLMQRGKNVKIEGLRGIGAIPDNSSVLLFNVSVDAPGYNTLLHRVALEEIQCYPDPFIKLFEKDATTLKRAYVSGRFLPKFLEAIRPTNMDTPARVFTKYRTIDEALKMGGIDTDIVYFDIPDHNEPFIPAFRYDTKSFSTIYKAIYKAEEKRGLPAAQQLRVMEEGTQAAASEYPIVVTAMPFKLEDAVLYGRDGPRLAVFRFMFVRI